MAEGARSLSEVPAGTSVFLDSTIFIYHFTGASPSCRDLLSRCEAGRLHAVTSAVAIAEVSHRLMTIEAVARGLVSPADRDFERVEPVQLFLPTDLEGAGIATS